MRDSAVLRRTLVIFVLAALVAPSAFAQRAASVAGTVRDTGGDPLPGVTVVLEMVGGDARYDAVTRGDGTYLLDGVAPGGYTLTATLPGFREAEADLELTAGGTVTRDLTLGFAFYENITVTSQKREEEILDVPMSITAVTGDSVERQEATTLQDIAATIPSLSMVDTGPGFQRVQLRGISSPLNLPTVGLYLDEMPINIDATGSALDVRLLDLERIEVLRGPQGTLYGEGSMGGTIKYVTRDPELDAFDMSFDSAYGTVADGDETYRGSLVANIPVVEGTFGLRVVGAFERSPGWVDYPALEAENVNEGESTTLRVKGKWVVTDNLVATLMLQGQDSDYDGQVYADEDRTAPGYILHQPASEESRLANLVLTYDAGGFTILSSTGYMDRENLAVFDFSTLYVPIFDLIGVPPGTVTNSAVISDGDTDVLTQELRFASTGSGRLDWTVGAYYRDLETSGRSYSESEGNPLPYDVQDIITENTSEQFSIFGNLDYAFSDAFTATVGVRYFEDERFSGGASGSFGPTTPNPERRDTFDSVDPRFVLSFRPSEATLVYASAAKGFRSGGFNTVVPGCDLPNLFDPEKLWTYEVGTSSSLSDGRLVVQGAIYYNDWTEIQTLSICPNIPVRQTTNTGEASGTGVDLQLTITPAAGLRFTLAGNYNDSQYDTDSLNNAEGDPIDYVAEYTFGLAADWSFDWTDGFPGLLHADYQLTGPFSLGFRSLGLEPLESDAVGLLNARLAVVLDSVEVSLFARNLLDEDGAVQPAIPFGGLLEAVRPQPRTIGVGFGWRY